jgi:hypothetical protein
MRLIFWGKHEGAYILDAKGNQIAVAGKVGRFSYRSERLYDVLDRLDPTQLKKVTYILYYYYERFGPSWTSITTHTWMLQLGKEKNSQGYDQAGNYAGFLLIGKSGSF